MSRSSFISASMITPKPMSTEGEQTISGVKIFSETPLIPTPVESALGQEAVNVEYVERLGVLSDIADLKQNKADKNIPVIDIPSTSGTVTLADNTIYSGTMTGAMTFVLPTVTDATKYHQIKAMLYLPVVTIDWGTTHYIGGEAPDVSEAGQYMIYWDYVPALSDWAVGAMKVG